MRRQLVIGDIHGCFGELIELMDLAGLVEGDEIIAVGDLVDRGPNTAAVLDFFQTRPTATAVMGNHERKNVRSHAGQIPPALSQQITRRQLGESRYHEACAFMARLPRAIELLDAIVVHAFWQPGRRLADQDELVIVGTLTGERLVREACAGRPWYELYDGSKPLIVGHRDYLRTGQPLVVRDRVFCLDTSCVHGGRLTGLLLPEFRIISVRARRPHWADVRREFDDGALTRGAGEVHGTAGKV